MATAKTSKKKVSPKKKEPLPHTTALHLSIEDGSHVVGIGNLRVMLFNDDGSWFAQGLEIDYFAQGDSMEDARERFESGLCATFSEHLKTHGTIEGALRVAPQEVWQDLYANPALRSYSKVSFHAPQFSNVFSGIQYLLENAA